MWMLIDIMAIFVLAIVLLYGFVYLFAGIDLRSIKETILGSLMVILSIAGLFLCDYFGNMLTSTCPFCGKLNYRKEYCTNCGVHLSEASEQKTLSRCPNCNNKVSADNHYCGHCGIDLYENTTEETTKGS